MDDLINCHVVGCSKLAINQFVTKLCPLLNIFFFLVQNVVGKIDKETLRFGFRINPTFWFKKIIKKVFIIGQLKFNIMKIFFWHKLNIVKFL
jgi:hypothetical protein